MLTIKLETNGKEKGQIQLENQVRGLSTKSKIRSSRNWLKKRLNCDYFTSIFVQLERLSFETWSLQNQFGISDLTEYSHWTCSWVSQYVKKGVWDPCQLGQASHTTQTTQVLCFKLVNFTKLFFFGLFNFFLSLSKNIFKASIMIGIHNLLFKNSLFVGGGWGWGYAIVPPMIMSSKHTQEFILFLYLDNLAYTTIGVCMWSSV